jgi:hypothetical protein
MFPKSRLLALWLSATVCLAEEPSFPNSVTGVQFIENQYIVQFEGADDFEQAKLSTLNDNKVQVVRHIDTRKIGVYKFSSKKAAAKWREKAGEIKYFEAGEKCGACTLFKTRGARPGI